MVSTLPGVSSLSMMADSELIPAWEQLLVRNYWGA